MNPKQTTPPPMGLTPREVYYILCRHKWLIAIVATVGIITGVLVRVLWPLPYESKATLEINYVPQSKPPVQSTPDSAVMALQHEDGIINAELAILQSWDLATNVVGILTPAKILANEGGGTNVTDAALLIGKKLKVSVAPRTYVIDLSFSHHDPEMATLILNRIIEAYKRIHNDVHRPEFNDFLTHETDDLRGKLRETDEQLREAKKKGNVEGSLSEGQSAIAASLSRLQQELYDAQTELAGDQQTIKELRTLLPKDAQIAATNTSAPPEEDAVPPEKVAEYQAVRDRLASLRADEEKLLMIYKTNNSLVLTNEALMRASEATKKELEAKYKGLTAIRTAEAKSAPATATPALDPEVAINEEIIKAGALAVRIRVITNQLAEVRGNAETMSGVEGTILDLQRQRDQEESALDFYLKKLQESHADDIFNQDNSNINTLQSPTPAMRDEVKINKTMTEIIIVGLVLAFGLPFLIELVLDRTLKHPADVQSKLALPFFVSMPKVTGNGKYRALKKPRPTRLLTVGQPGAQAPSGAAGTPPSPSPEAAAPAAAAATNNGRIAGWQDHPALQPFYETLRDRLMTFFEMINLTHKPKLVAVTSCSPGAGVTTTAVGLASSLSETGDGNVLLVDMNVRDGEAHHFYKGKLTCGLEEVLEKGTRDNAFVQGNLYVAKEQPEDDRLPRVLPKRFSHLLPKMKASDFDYIIFDMPPVSQISITPRLARFMDMVLLVIESGKTDRDIAKRVASLLTESKANVGVVLNKNQAYLPGKLQHDI